MKTVLCRCADVAALALASVAIVGALLVPSPANAADSPDAAERVAIARERTAAEARFVAADLACRERFAVSGCIEDARRARRGSLDALRSRQLVIDEARRKERAETRRAELAARAADDARREQERAVRAALAASAASTASAASSARGGKRFEGRRDAGEAAPRSPGSPRQRSPAGGHRRAASGAASSLGTGERQARDARSRAAYEARHRKAAAHREQADAAAAERLRQHAPARPLPVPVR
ncbi:MAG: hypothetical protein ABIO71_03675 [Caldimonas sp.]